MRSRPVARSVPRRAEQRRAAAGARTAADVRAPLPTRYRRRRLAAALLAVVGLLVVVVLGTRVLLYDAGLANVEDVTVTGLTTVPEQAVRDAAAVTPGGPLDLGRHGGHRASGSRPSRASPPWTCAGRGRTPSRSTSPSACPVALWQTPQGLFEVDGTGLSYRRAPDPPPALPRLAFTGVAPQDPVDGRGDHRAARPHRPAARPGRDRRRSPAPRSPSGSPTTARYGGATRSARPDKIAVLGPCSGSPGSVYDVSSPDLPTVRP